MSAIKGTGTIHEIESLEEFTNYRKNSGTTLVVVDFYADWCGPCKAIKPTFKELAKEYKDVCFIQVNVDEQEDISAECKVECMPTFIFYKNGEQLQIFSGANTESLRKAVKDHSEKEAK